MESIHRLDRRCADRDMRTAVSLESRHTPPLIDPEFRIILAEADGARLLPQFLIPDRSQHGLIKPGSAIEIAHANADVIDALNGNLLAYGDLLGAASCVI